MMQKLSIFSVKMQKKHKGDNKMDCTTKKMTFNDFIPHLIATIGAMFAFFGANAGCCFIFHQPEKPNLSKLRRF